MKHREVGVGSFFPADEDPAKAIHPTVSALDNPATRLEASRLLDGRRFLSATANVRGEAELEELEQMPIAFSAFHWQPVRSTNRIAFIAARFGTRGLWHPSGCDCLRGSAARHKVSGIRHPSSCCTRPIYIW